MSSTRDKNQRGDYLQQQRINHRIDNYMTYINSAPAKAHTSHFPGDGLLMGKNARETFCHNYVDVETELFGISSSNLVNPTPKVMPQFEVPKSLNIIDRMTVLVPEPLIVQKDNRPMYLN
jgi:hypothetical protein